MHNLVNEREVFAFPGALDLLGEIVIVLFDFSELNLNGFDVD